MTTVCMLSTDGHFWVKYTAHLFFFYIFKNLDGLCFWWCSDSWMCLGWTCRSEKQQQPVYYILLMKKSFVLHYLVFIHFSQSRADSSVWSSEWKIYFLLFLTGLFCTCRQESWRFQICKYFYTAIFFMNWVLQPYFTAVMFSFLSV